MMKKIAIIILFAPVLFTSCKKGTTVPNVNLPWQFTLEDSTAAKAYSYNAQTYQQGYNRNYPYFNCTGSSDSTARFGMSADATAVLQNSSTINISIGLGSFTDSLKSQKLAKGSTLLIKQNTLKEIYASGRIITATGNLIQNPLWFQCYYTAETGTKYTTNFLNLFNTDFIKIKSSEIWNDGSGIAKIKVSLEYTCHVQGYTSGIGWLPEIKKISGTMQTFFTVQ